VNKKLLTFEFSQSEGLLEIHVDENGLNTLIDILKGVKKHGDHVHLMTQSWGGSELSDEKQGENNILINHVKIAMWK